MANLEVRILAREGTATGGSAEEHQCVYARLSPPVLRPGQYGEIVAKLSEAPTNDAHLRCTVSAGSGIVSQTAPLEKSALWISYVAFSEDFRRAYVYAENLGTEPARVKLLKVGDGDRPDQATPVRSVVLPGHKGCLVGDLASPVSRGAFVHVVIVEDTGERKSEVHVVTRAIRAFPVVMEHGNSEPRLAVDIQRPFTETMACPAHKHGSQEAASARFLDDYARRFSENPHQLIQMAICRSSMPEAWFRFGTLPDAAAMNPCLRPPSRYGENPQSWFCPFFCVGELAKKATEPGRYLAIIPTGPNTQEGSLLLKGLAPQEWRFLVYNAIASGAKGVIYRGQPGRDRLNRDAFRQLNRELQQLRPLLSISEPIQGCTTEHSDYAIRSLLCGDQAILIMAFDRRYFSEQRKGRFYTPPFGRAVIPVRARVKIPGGMAIQSMRTPFASLDHDCWACQDSSLSFTTEMLNSVHVYVASLQREPRLSKEGPSR